MGQATHGTQLYQSNFIHPAAEYQSQFRESSQRRQTLRFDVVARQQGYAIVRYGTVHMFTYDMVRYEINKDLLIVGFILRRDLENFVEHFVEHFFELSVFRV
jgi:hypothetical protein